MRSSFPYGELRIGVLIGYLMYNPSANFTPGNGWILGILGCACLYFLCRFLLIGHPRLHIPLHLALLLWGICEAVYGNLQLYGYYASNNGLYKMTGTFLNPGPFSGFLATIFPLALSYLLHPAKDSGYLPRIIRYVSGACLLLTLLLLPAGMSRAAWVAVIVGSLIVFGGYHSFRELFQKYDLRQKRKMLWGCSGLLVLLIVASVSVYYLKKDSADGRLLIWKITTQLIAEHPVTGVGAGNFAGAYGEAQAAYFNSGKNTPQETFVAGCPEYGFNEFLQIAAEHGIPALLLFLTVLVFAFRNARINRQYGIAGSLAAFLTFACFSYPFSVPQSSILFALLLGCANSDFRPRPETCYRKQLLFTGIPLLILLFPLLRTGQQWKIRQEAIDSWKGEQTYYQMQIYESATEHYRKLYPVLKDEPRFLFELGQCLSKTGAYEESNRILREGSRFSSDPMFWNIMGKNHQALKQYREAEACFLRAGAMVPHRLYPLYLLAHLYFESQQTEKGIATARTVISRTPKVMSAATEEMKAEMKEKLSTFTP
ncbi:MAG: O-antigen ligase family protein [Odoribacter sp.]|nr:O-antigen ligase family protein [Odoribacter sp.]